MHGDTSASAEWQLLAAVHPIFASKVPSLSTHGRSESTRDILQNLETIFEFEIWLLPDALQEAQIHNISKNASQGVLVLTSLLDIFERCVDERVLHFCHKQDSWPQPPRVLVRDHTSYVCSAPFQHVLIPVGLSKTACTGIRAKEKTCKPKRQSLGPRARAYLSGMGWHHPGRILRCRLLPRTLQQNSKSQFIQHLCGRFFPN